ncbi:hypothetical protein SAMN05216344_12462 [Polaromonas sp. OV174]|nr:hypothetical protein SAMN05216344_12462 [Polaromonas sp. OV174]
MDGKQAATRAALPARAAMGKKGFGAARQAGGAQAANRVRGNRGLERLWSRGMESFSGGIRTLTPKHDLAASTLQPTAAKLPYERSQKKFGSLH